MKNFLLFVILSVPIFAHNTTLDNQSTKKLESALINPDTFNQNLTSQVGIPMVYLDGTLYSDTFFRPNNSSNLRFSGIGKFTPRYRPKYDSTSTDDDSFGFLFRFEKRGDSISVGGDVKGVDIDILNNYLTKEKE